MCWRRGDGFGVRYQRAGETADTHLPGVTTWHASIAKAMDAIRAHHEGLVRTNTAPRHRSRRSSRRSSANADLRAARARLAGLLQPGLSLASLEEDS
jgi:hypothetical protein